MAVEHHSAAFEPPHPGEYLREDVLPALDMSASAFARHLGVAEDEIMRVLAGESPITTDLAIRFGQALRNGARFWLALQLQRDLWTAERLPVSVAPLTWGETNDAA